MFLRRKKASRMHFDYFTSTTLSTLTYALENLMKFKFFPKTKCKVTVEPEYFIEFAVCSQIKPCTQTFPGISCHPIVPWPQLVITSIDIPGRNKIQCICKPLEHRCINQCINHFNDGFLIL